MTGSRDTGKKKAFDIWPDWRLRHAVLGLVEEGPRAYDLLPGLYQKHIFKGIVY